MEQHTKNGLRGLLICTLLVVFCLAEVCFLINDENVIAWISVMSSLFGIAILAGRSETSGGPTT